MTPRDSCHAFPENNFFNRKLVVMGCTPFIPVGNCQCEIRPIFTVNSSPHCYSLCDSKHVAQNSVFISVSSGSCSLLRNENRSRKNTLRAPALERHSGRPLTRIVSVNTYIAAASYLLACSFCTVSEVFSQTIPRDAFSCVKQNETLTFQIILKTIVLQFKYDKQSLDTSLVTRESKENGEEPSQRWESVRSLSGK